MIGKSQNSMNAQKWSGKVQQSESVIGVTRKRSEKDAAAAVQLCRGFLTVLGVWRLSGSGRFSWRIVQSNFSLIACYFGLGIRTIPTIVYIFFDARDVIQICHLVGRALFCLMSWSKYVLLRLHRRDIETCMKNIELDWLGVETAAGRNIMLKHSRYGLLVTRICAGFTYTGATWQAILPYVLRRAASSVVSDNMTQVVPVRTFAVPSHFGFTLATKTPIYEIIYTSQVAATFMMHSIAIACYSIAVVSVMHACGQLNIVMEKINNLIDGDCETVECNSVDSRLSNIISHHVRTLRFISSAEKMLREICLIDLGGCTVELCILGYFNLLEWRAEHKNVIGIIVYLTVIITFVFNIFSFCYIGELLTQECSKVAEMTYMIDWYRLPGKQPLALCLIITMAHSPVALTAGGAIQLSFRCFANVSVELTKLPPKVVEASIKKEAAYAMQICRKFLTILGVWDWDKFSWHLVLSNLSVIICYFGIGMRTIPTVLYIILDSKDTVQICNLIARALFGIMNGTKYIYLRSRRREIERCMSHIELDWLCTGSTVNRKIMLEYARYGHLVTRICAGFTFSGATWYAILPFMLKRGSTGMTIENVTVVPPDRAFALPSHFGVAFVTETPIYEFIYTSQVVATFLMHSIGVTCYSLAVVIVMHACGQLKILMEKIGALVGEEDDEGTGDNFDNRLSDVISHHVRALRFISSAEKMLREICLVDLGGGTVELCVLGYFNLLEWKKENKNPIGILAYLTLFTTFLFNIYSFCYIGELLTQECSKVGEVTYMIDWHRLPGKQPLAVCLIITMANSPVTLTAGGAIQLSFTCFASVVKTSMGYLNMLRAVMD